MTVKNRPDARAALWLPTSLLALLTAVTAPGCSGDPTPEPTDEPTSTANGTPTEPAGGEDFTSAFSGGTGGDGAPAPEAGEEDSAGDGGEREVEEADIFTQVGDTLFILNAYRGLQILDVSDPDHPRMQGRVAMTGYPVEMYVRNGRAYIVVSDYYSYWPTVSMEGDAAGASAFRGSSVAIVDVSNAGAPSLLGRINLEGYVTQTRAVGDVLYAVTTLYPWYGCGDTASSSETMTYVTSIDIRDPSAPTQVDTLTWAGSWAQIHATSNTLYVVEPWYDGSTGDGTAVEGDGGSAEDGSGGSAEGGSGGSGSSSGTSAPDAPATPTPKGDNGGGSDDEAPPPDEPATSYYQTRVTLVDISDPGGIIAERGAAIVPGATWDKFALDEYDDTFRIVTQKWDGVTSGTLTVLDVSDKDHPTQLSTMDIVLPQLESVTATRFDGDRAYIVTAEQTDPLFVVDLGDPAAPRLAGQVEMPGRIDHIEPLDDQLVAFGTDNSEEGTNLFAVSLFDVADMDAPTMLDRETVGPGQYSWSAASWDDKSFSVLPDLGLIAVPFSAWSSDWTEYFGGVQLMDLGETSLTVRGIVTHDGYVQRVRDVNGSLYSLSDTELLAIDIADRDHPVVTADQMLVRNVVDYLPGEEYGAQLTTGGWYYNTAPAASLRIVPDADADTMGEATAQIDLTMNDGQLITLDSGYVGLISTTYESNAYVSTLQIYDLDDPTSPELISSLELPAPVWSYASQWSYSWGSSGGAVVQTGDVLAYLETWYYYGGVGEDTSEPGESSDGAEPQPGPTPTPKGRATADEDNPLTRLHVIDLSDITAPKVTTVSYADDSLFNLWGEGDRLYATHVVQTTDTYPYVARYFLDIIDVTDPAAPAKQAPINVPGTAIRAIDGDTLVTLDHQWAKSPDGYDYQTSSLDTIRIRDGRASRLSQVDLPGSVYSLLANDDGAYALSQPFWWESESQGCWYGAGMSLLAVDLGDPTDLAITSSQELPAPYGYIRALEGGRLFVDNYSGGLLYYDVATDPLVPAYDDFVRTSGWVNHVRVLGDRAYLPSGYYGVQTADL